MDLTPVAGGLTALNPTAWLWRLQTPRLALRSIWLVFGLAAGVIASGITTLSAASVGATLSTADKRELQREVRLIIDLLQNFHYAERAFHEIEGREIVARLLDVLDPDGNVFTEADSEFLFRRFGRSLKSVYLIKGDVQPGFEIFDFFATRSRERLEWIDARLEQDFDFTTNETFTVVTEPPRDRAEAESRWEQRLKDELMEEILAGRELADAIVVVRERYARWRRQIATMDALAVREMFLETVVNLFDPHSGYFSADTSREFAVEMEGAVGGVGLDLRKEAGQCVIAGVRAGGPAEAHGGIMPGDRIVAIAAVPGNAPLAAAGLRLREIVDVLRGKPGTTVRLVIAAAEDAPGAPEREVVLGRARVILPEERARGRIVTVPLQGEGERRVGWIELPSFYVAGEHGEAASATRDVRELITSMFAFAPAPEALVVDLRQNPGGALTEAVAFSGLFVPGGAVMATRDLDGTITVHRAENAAAPIYAGPLVVLTSPASASASEIVAGALHYHRRALIVGGPSTFGKGTVQSYMDLEKSPARGTGGLPWGTLRLTSQQFFFPDGSPVQRTGAVSDLELPGWKGDESRREVDLPHALPAETIAVADVAPAAGEFARVDDALVAWLRQRVDERTAGLPEFAAAREWREVLETLREPKEKSLQLEKRREAREERDSRLRGLRRSLFGHAAGVRFAEQTVDTAEVRAALAAQAATLGPRLWPDGAEKGGRLWGLRYWFVASDGGLRSAALDDVPYRDFREDLVELAAAFTEASGIPLTPEELAPVWTEVALLEEKSGRTILACFASVLESADADTAAIARGVDALFRRLAAIDGSWLEPGSVLDVAGREAIRLASDWAEWQVQELSSVQ